MRRKRVDSACEEGRRRVTTHGRLSIIADDGIAGVFAGDFLALRSSWRRLLPLLM